MKSYFFTLVAVTDGTFSGFDGAPAINESGTLAWKGLLQNDGSGIFVRQNGQGISSIADTNQGFTEFGYATINNSGTTAFYANNNTQSGIYLGTGKSTTLVAQTGQHFQNYEFTGFLPDPAISNVGTVAFIAQLRNQCSGSSGSGLFVGSDRAIKKIADTEGTFSGFNFFDFVGTPQSESDVSPSINNRGDVAFLALLDKKLDPELPLYDQPTYAPDQVRGIFVASKTGAITKVVDNQGDYRSFAGSPGINNQGEVAYVFSKRRSETEQTTPFIRGINVYEKGKTKTIVNNTGDYAIFGAPAINDRGDIAFSSLLDDGVVGIYTGVNPSEDKVIDTNDSIGGKEIADFGLVFFNKGLNNKGQIAFLATFEDDSQGMYRADPCGAGDRYKIRSLGDEHSAFPVLSDDKAIKACLTPKSSSF